MSNPLNGILGSSGGGSGGSGDVVGPAVSTDNAIARWDLATGKLLQNSVVTIADTTGDITLPATLSQINFGGTAAANASIRQFNMGATVTLQALKADASSAASIRANYFYGENGAATAGAFLCGAGGGEFGLALGTNSAHIGWSSTTDAIAGAKDVGLLRSAAGVVKVTNGGAGSGSITAATCNGTTSLTAGASGASGVLDSSGFVLGSGQFIGISDNASAIAGTYDVRLARVSAGQLAVQNGANGMANNIKIATTTVNASGATSTATNLVPAGCILLGVTTLVTTAITSGDGGTSVNIGNGTDADMYGAAIAFTLGTTTNLSNHTASALAFKSAAESVVFTCVGGTFSGGVWRVCAHYLDLTAPTS